MSVSRAGSAEPVYFVGDSATLIFRNRLYKSPGHAQPLLGRSIYLPGLHAVDMCTPAGTVHPQVIGALALENLLVTDATGHWRRFHEDISVVTKLLAGVMGFGSRSPAVVFFCGGFDAMRLMEEFGGGSFEIDLPAYLPQPGGSPVSGVRVYSFEEAIAIARRYIEPYGRALAQLKSYGLTNLFVHDLPPMGNDAEWGRLCAIDATQRSRYATVILVNYLLRVMADYVGLPFIELWPRVIGHDGFVDPYYQRDAMHLNGRAALLTMGEVLGRSVRSADEPAAREPVDRVDLSNTQFDDDYDFGSIARPDIEPLAELIPSTG